MWLAFCSSEKNGVEFVKWNVSVLYWNSAYYQRQYTRLHRLSLSCLTKLFGNRLFFFNNPYLYLMGSSHCICTTDYSSEVILLQYRVV